MSDNDKPKPLILDKFSFRSFDSTRNSNYISISKEEFIKKVNELYKSSKDLVEGYAPFCKHLFVKNFVKGFKPCHLEINEKIKPLIISKYDSRQKNELPVLIRYIDLKTINKEEIPDALFLDLILYSKEQIISEMKEMKADEKEINEMIEKDFDWGIISIKPLNIDHELPFVPITLMRNSLGKNEGGSGVPIDRKKYMEGVEFWSKNVELK